MGDAYLPLGDDAASALFYNPADFGKIRKPDAEPIHFELGLNSGAVSNLGINAYKLTEPEQLSAHARRKHRNLPGIPGRDHADLRDEGFRLRRARADA